MVIANKYISVARPYKISGHNLKGTCESCAYRAQKNYLIFSNETHSLVFTHAQRHNACHDTHHDTRRDTRHDTHHDARHDTYHDVRHDIMTQRYDACHDARHDTCHNKRHDAML
jgi:hypothetical protein